MKKSFLSTIIFGVMVMMAFSFTQVEQLPETQREKRDTIEGTERYKNQIEVPIVRDSVPPPAPDSLPVPPDSFPVPPFPVPDSIPQK